MLDYLLGYITHMEEQFAAMNNKIPQKAEVHMTDVRYDTLMAMKKFVLEDMVPYFIDQDMRELKAMKDPTRDLVHTTLKRWEEFCDKYPDYLDKQQIKDYMVGQLIQEE